MSYNLRRFNTSILTTAVAALLFVVGSGYSDQTEAANWFKLRGTEPGATAHTLQVWGFLQPTYVSDRSGKIKGAIGGAAPLNGTTAVPATIAPNRKEQRSFFMRRARFGIRGTMLPISNDVDYFLLIECGQNGTNFPDHDCAALDTSVTFNQLSRGRTENGLHKLGARFRIGQFLFSQTSEALSHSTPGRRVHIFMPEATFQMALTRRVVDNGPGNFKGVKVNGGRDVGIEVFDFAEFAAKNGGPWEFTYSLAVGNGGTIGELNQDSNFRKYAWVSFAKLLDHTRGPRRHDIMVYAWWQKGDIEFNNDINGDGLPDDTQSIPSGGIHPVTGLGGTINRVTNAGNKLAYEQKYTGIGFEYFGRNQLRIEAEYQRMTGLVFDGTQSPSAFFNKANGLGLRYATDGESEGWYVDVGYDINRWWKGKKRVTLNLRYDEFDRNKDNPGRAASFQTWSLTGEYFFHKKARATFTFQRREFDADLRAAGGPKTNGNAVLNSVENRISAQVTFIFKNVLLR